MKELGQIAGNLKQKKKLFMIQFKMAIVSTNKRYFFLVLYFFPKCFSYEELNKFVRLSKVIHLAGSIELEDLCEKEGGKSAVIEVLP